MTDATVVPIERLARWFLRRAGIRDPDVVDDAVQDVLVILLERGTRGTHALSTRVRGAVRDVIRREVRRRVRVEKLRHRTPPANTVDPSPGQTLAVIEGAGLTRAGREACLMRRAGRDCAEIAQALGICRSSVRRRLRHAWTKATQRGLL